MQQDYKMQLSSSEIYSLLSPLKVGTQSMVPTKHHEFTEEINLESRNISYWMVGESINL